MSNKFLPPLICGFGGAVLATVPILKSFGCCLIIPAAAVFSLMLYKKVTNDSSKISGGRAFQFGILTGLFAAIFVTIIDILITYITKSNDLIATLPQSEIMMREMNLGPLMDESLKLLKEMAKEISTTGFSFLYTIAISISNLITHSIFGMLGGFLGMAILNRRNTTE
jgi:hypothetical protein